jgi:hypothetical protein
MELNRENIRKITGYAPLNYDDSNPGIVIFSTVNQSSSRSAVDKLKQAGIDARTLFSDAKIVIVTKPKSDGK